MSGYANRSGGMRGMPVKGQAFERRPINKKATLLRLLMRQLEPSGRVWLNCSTISRARMHAAPVSSALTLSGERPAFARTALTWLITSAARLVMD